VHLFYLVGFKNRLTAVLHWFVSFLGRGRSERVSTVQQAFGRQAIREYGDPFQRVREQIETSEAPDPAKAEPEADPAKAEAAHPTK
jgi:NADH dehydrogenase